MLVRTIRSLLLISLLCSLIPRLSAQTTLFEEGFETDGNGTRYSSSVPEFSDGSNDFFTRTDGGNISGGYDVGTPEGSFFFAAQDIDGEGASAQQSIEWTGIDITGASNLSLSGLFAEDDNGSNQNWDAADLVFVEVSLDGGPFEKILQFANDGSTFNGEPSRDSDFDGVGDGVEVLTDAFAEFVAAIPGTGSTLDLRITCILNSGDEDIAFDALKIAGDLGGGSTPGTPVALLEESFETDGNDARYSTSVPEFSDGSGDFFTRTDGSNISGGYAVSGADGDFFFAAQDIDGEVASATQTLTFTGINITGASNLSFTGLFAEDDDGSNQDWDASDLVFVEVSIDGGPFEKILQFANDGSSFNGEPSRDSDFDGVGDGVEVLTDVFTEFVADIPGSGSAMDLRITSTLNAGDEDIAFDLIKVIGTPTGDGCTDTEAPLAQCVTSFEVQLDETGAGSLNPADLDAGSSDDCTDALLLGFSASQTSFDCSDVSASPLSVTLTVTDLEGKSSTCPVAITVKDEVAPTVVTQNISVDLDATGQATLTPMMVDGGSSDACGIASRSLDIEQLDCDDVSEVVVPTASDLFFSEYIEGSGNNKYLEIFNGTGAPVDLSDYQVALYSNGSTSANNTEDLSGTLADGAVLVIANGSANLYGGSAITSSVTFFNGDDAIALIRKSDGALVDVFGVIGEDPGSQWNVAGVETQNQTLRRKMTVSQGIVPGAGFAELADQWEEFPIDDASGLGSHGLAPVPSTIAVTLTVIDASGNSATGIAQVTVNDPLGVCDLPAMPTDLTVNSDTAFLPSLRWVDNSSDEEGFNVYRSLDGGSTFSLLAQVPADFFFYYDELGSGSATYYVTAFNANGESAPSNQATYDFAPFSLLDLNFVCYDATNDSLTWSVTSTNTQWVPFIYAQWWSPQRDTLYAAPNQTVMFKTKNNPQDANTFGDDNITGIWYWGLGLNTESDEVFTIDLSNDCGSARLGHMLRARKVKRFPAGLQVNTQAGLDRLLAESLEVGPNPTADHLMIRTEGLDQVATFRLLNSTGQTVLQQQGNLAQPTKLDLSQLSRGVYFLQIQAGGARYGQQIVRE